MTDIKCIVKHAAYQPTNEEWSCPKCGKYSESFWIEESSADGECPLLHNTDIIVCFRCGYGTSGKNFAARLQKSKKSCPVPMLQGKGSD